MSDLATLDDNFSWLLTSVTRMRRELQAGSRRGKVSRSKLDQWAITMELAERYLAELGGALEAYRACALRESAPPAREHAPGDDLAERLLREVAP